MSSQLYDFNISHNYTFSIGEVCALSILQDALKQDSHFIDFTVTPIGAVIGVLLNLTVVLLIITTRELHNTNNVYIFMICTCNILSLTSFAVQVFLLRHLPTLYRLPWFNLCINGVTNLAISLSVFTMVLLAYERWRAVVRPFWLNVVGVGWKAFGVVALAVCHTTAWITMALFLRNNEYTIFVVYYKILVTYIIPLSIIFVLYIFVARTLCRKNPHIKESVQRNDVGRKRDKSACLVICLIVNFATFRLPLNMVEVLLVHNRACFFIRIIVKFHILFYFLDSVCDPLATFLLSSDFRKHLISALRRFGFAKLRNFCATELH